MFKFFLFFTELGHLCRKINERKRLKFFLWCFKNTALKTQYSIAMFVFSGCHENILYYNTGQKMS